MVLCAGVAAQGRTRGLNFFVWNFAWDRLASQLYAATATTFLMKMDIFKCVSLIDEILHFDSIFTEITFWWPN